MEQAAQDYLNARKEARAPKDSNEQPESVEAVNVLENSAPIEEVEAEVLTDEDTTTIEESEAQATEAQSEETELFYYDIDDEEVSSDQLKEWKNNGLMQADYTRKTQAHAKDVEAFEASKAELSTSQAKLSEQLATLEAMISEDSLDAEDIAELR